MSEDWNQEFTELVRRWAGGPHEVAPTETDGPETLRITATRRRAG